jgi:hypothetical protein
MTRFPHDQFAKDFLESLLSPLGQVQTSLKISGEVREMDVFFTPDPNLAPTSDLGLLTSCTSLIILVISVDPGYPQGAPLQVICRGAPCGYPPDLH